MNADFSHTCEGCEHVVTEPWAKDIISYVYPKGTRRHGNKRRAAEVAFVDEFGKRGQPARPFIQTANEKAADRAIDAAARVYDDFLKSKNF